ncbi:ribonuclease H-like domain-containing protein [Tanacetum coccineum]
MAKLILNEAQTEQYLAKPSIESNEKYELDEELLKELRSNSYCGRVEEDVVGHIATILEILDPIEVDGMDLFQLRMMTFPLSLSGKARNWWKDEGDGKINTWEELKKSLYGLKQAPRQWNAKLTFALIENGFSQGKSDYSLYNKSDKGVFVALLVYVNDIIIPGNSISEIDKFKTFLKSKFMIKDLGKLKYFLGIEVIDTDKGICHNQRKYVLDLLSEYSMLACKPAKTLLQSKPKGLVDKLGLFKVESANQIAYILTKWLDIIQHKGLVDKLGLFDNYHAKTKGNVEMQSLPGKRLRD